MLDFNIFLYFYTKPVKPAHMYKSTLTANRLNVGFIVYFVACVLFSFYWYQIGLPFKIFGGMKNIFNSYQNDFDYGADRDPGYIYGPSMPRTIYLGIKLSNVL